MSHKEAVQSRPLRTNERALPSREHTIVSLIRSIRAVNPRTAMLILVFSSQLSGGGEVERSHFSMLQPGFIEAQNSYPVISRSVLSPDIKCIRDIRLSPSQLVSSGEMTS